MLVGFDTETALIRTGEKAPPLVCYSVSKPGSSPSLHSRAEKKLLHKLWSDAAEGAITLLMQNAPFDAAVCMRHMPELTPLIFEAYRKGSVSDIMIRQMLLDIETGGYPRRRSLAQMTAQYVGRELEGKEGPDVWRLRYWDLRDVPIQDWPEPAVSYAKTDAEILHKIHAAQEFEKKHADTFADEAAQCRAHFALHLMTSWGLKTDVQHVERLTDDFYKLNLDREKILTEFGIMVKGKVKQAPLADYIENSLGEKLDRTPTGKPSLKSERLENIDDLIVQTYLEFKHDTKMINTYLAKYKAGLVQCTVNPILANGRSSLAKPSLQNLPQDGPIRESFVPRPGRIMCSIDYDGIELRTLAQAFRMLLPGEKNPLAEAFQNDPKADVHAMLARDLTSAQPGTEEFDKARGRAKGANFGFPGGMGVDRFIGYQKARGSIYSKDEATKLRNAYTERWNMRPYFLFVGDLVGAEGESEMCTLVSGRWRGACSYSKIANGFFSSLMADGSKAATFEIVRQCYSVPSSPIFGARIVNAVHDEVIMEFDEDAAHEQAHHTAEIFCDVMRTNYTPDIPITAEPALMRRWYKKAKPVYEKGRLIPWEPK
jgi:DNA polymerase I-like protein with 3'-5' exonuclease and polymerase domains